jgi:hypothetical protein
LGVCDGVVVDDGVDDLAGRNLRLHLVQEADELLMAVALHAAADDRSVQDIGFVMGTVYGAEQQNTI